MQGMCLGETTQLRQNGLLSVSRFRGLRRFPTVRKCFGYRPALKHNPQGRKGGTVVPPCDFQSWSLGKPVFIGLPP